MIWKNAEQISQALADMHNVFRQLPIEAEEFLIQKMYDYMWQRNNTSVYAFRVFKENHENALSYGVDIRNASILEIGGGESLGTGILWNFAGAKKYTSVDKFTRIDLSHLWVQRFETILDMNIFNPEGFRLDSLIKKEDGRYVLREDKIRLIQGSFEEYPLEHNSFGFIYSSAVLEHVSNIERILQKMSHVLSDDGLMIHTIDLREHHTNLRTVPDKNTSVEFLKYSTEDWNKMYPPGSLHYINRLRASDFHKYFEDAGFKILDFITTQEMELTEAVYSIIHPEFHRYALDDLNKIGIRVVLKKHNKCTNR